MDTLVKTLCVVSLVWIAGFSEHPQCQGYGTGPPDIGAVYDPNPSDGSIGVPIEPVLSWHMDGEMGDEDYTYDVYFGTGEDLKNPPLPLVVENLDSNEYNIGTLDFETTYHWRIVATEKCAYSPGDHRVSEGSLCSFTTYGGVIINEGFEGEFAPPGWWADSAWDQSDQSHTGESSARGTMADHLHNADLLSPVFNMYQDSSGSISLSFYYKREFPDRTPKLKFFIDHTDGDIELFSGWVDNDEWKLAEYTAPRSDIASKFRVVFRTYQYPAPKRTSVLVDDVLVKFNALK